MHFELYAGHFNDLNSANKSSGAAFTSVIVADGNIVPEQVQMYGQDDTYLSITIKGCLETLKLLAKAKIPNVAITLYTAHNNTSKLMERVARVFNNVRMYNAVGPSQLRDLVDMKLRRSNRSRLDNHSELVEIVMQLIELHRKLFMNFTFAAKHSVKKGQMLDACQYSEAHLHNCTSASNSESNVVEFKRGAS